MTDEEVVEIIRKENHTTDRWGAATYSTAQVRGVADMVRKRLQDVIDQQAIVIAQKDAKIYAYEAIIANSNFKAVLPKKGDK